MLHYSYFVHPLQFAFNARTSRGNITQHNAFIIKVHNVQNKNIIGYGEASPLKGLSPDYVTSFETQLQQILLLLNTGKSLEHCQLQMFPSIEFALETALADLHFGGIMKIFENDFILQQPIPINGLIWMADKDTMLDEAYKKIANGYNCIKIKVGNLDFDQECIMLESIRKKHSAHKLTIRLDANGAFTLNDAKEKLKELSRFEIHSIEQPIKPKQIDMMQEICASSKIKIALDEELIGVSNNDSRIKLLKHIKPQYIILKPTLLGGFAACNNWINIAQKNNINWWLTSALESNVGLNAIAQYASHLKLKNHQGLGTGNLYHNNFSSPIIANAGYLSYKANSNWNITFEQNI